MKGNFVFALKEIHVKSTQMTFSFDLMLVVDGRGRLGRFENKRGYFDAINNFRGTL